MITVTNSSHSFNDYYIARPSALGNPYEVEQYGRSKAIDLYIHYILDKIITKDRDVCDALNDIYKMEKAGEEINLKCWCKPLNCHGDIIKKIIELKIKFPKGIYAGVGARSAPQEILDRAKVAAFQFYCLGYKLRSGGADGCDKAFEEGHDKGERKYKKVNKEIYFARDGQRKDCLNIAKEVHPNWNACSDHAKLLHARNCLQILGKDLLTPVDFVLCWTENGESKGGTRTAIKIAEKFGIPVYNFGSSDCKEILLK